MNNKAKKIFAVAISLVMLASLSSCTNEIKREFQKEAMKQAEKYAKKGIDKVKGEIRKTKKTSGKGNVKKSKAVKPVKASSLAKLKYKGKMIVKVNKGRPKFSKKALSKKKVFTKYSKLDALGRCGKVTALIGPETLAEEERGSIGMYKPTGWHTVRYDTVGKGSSGYLYNRCHLLAFCLNGNSTNNEKNLITGTRQFNAGKRSMLTFELKTVKYIERTGNHVLYRVTPVFRDYELVARGVQMEGRSIEDNGKLKFNVYIHNHQDGITIDYKTGKSKANNGEEPKSAYGGY